MNLRLLALVLLVSLVLVQPGAGQNLRESTSIVTAATGLTLIVDFGNGTALDTTGLSGMTVLEVTQSVYSVSVDWSGSLAFVTAIGGVQNTAARAWQYWVNGAYASVACNIYELSDSDIIVWNRTSSGYTGTSSGQQIHELIIGAALVGGFGVSVLVVLYIVARRRG